MAKKEARPGRKLGHLIATALTAELAKHKALEAIQKIKLGDMFIVRSSEASGGEEPSQRNAVRYARMRRVERAKSSA